jgi:hypothetical protein
MFREDKKNKRERLERKAQSKNLYAPPLLNDLRNQ